MLVDLPKVKGFTALNTTDSGTLLSWTSVAGASGYLLSWRHISGQRSTDRLNTSITFL